VRRRHAEGSGGATRDSEVQLAPAQGSKASPAQQGPPVNPPSHGDPTNPAAPKG